MYSGTSSLKLNSDYDDKVGAREETILIGFNKKR